MPRLDLLLKTTVSSDVSCSLNLATLVFEASSETPTPTSGRGLLRQERHGRTAPRSRRRYLETIIVTLHHGPSLHPRTPYNH
jgi:hypothetical protein